MGCVVRIDTGQEEELHILDDNVVQLTRQYYKADGTIDKRYGEHPERKRADGEIRSTRMKCLYDNDEILAVYNVFDNRVKEAETLTKEKAARRNKAMFVAAINLGLRGGDLCKLHWYNIYDTDWKFLDRPLFRPEKTDHKGHGNGKTVELTWSPDFEIAMTDYLDWLTKHYGEQNRNDYIFTSQRTHYDEKLDKEVNYINPKEWYKIVESNRKEAGIEQKIGTHGLRKTMVHSYINNAEDRYDAKLDMQEALNHRDLRTTDKYACTGDDKIQRGKIRMACIYEQNENK